MRSTRRGFFWSSDRGHSSHVNTPMVTMRHISAHQTPWDWRRITFCRGTPRTAHVHLASATVTMRLAETAGALWWDSGLAPWMATRNDPNSLLFLHELDTWGWHNGPGKTAHNILRGLLCHILGVGTPGSACCHLTQGHWEQGNCLGTVCNRCRHADRCGKLQLTSSTSTL